MFESTFDDLANRVIALLWVGAACFAVFAALSCFERTGKMTPILSSIINIYFSQIKFAKI